MSFATSFSKKKNGFTDYPYKRIVPQRLIYLNYLAFNINFSPDL